MAHMRRLWLVSGTILAFSLAAATVEHVSQTRDVLFTYTVTVHPTAAPSKSLDLWIPVPHDDDYQQIRALTVESPAKYEFTSAPNGNRYVHFERPVSPADLKVVVRFEARRTERWQGAFRPQGNQADAETLAAYLKPDRLVPLDDKIRGWSAEVIAQAHAQTDLEKARAIYNHVVSTVKYDKSGKGWGRGDIYYACDARRGNCTDFHAIFIGYARAAGIPARFSIGFPLPKDRGTGKIAGYHCWAEFYAQGIGWIPVDASEAAKDPARREYFFGDLDENRIQFSTGRDLVLVPKQAGEPLNYFVYPYAESDGKPLDGIESTFEFKDIAANGGR
jgi:transglutaminase-like putative cysteine protease